MNSIRQHRKNSALRHLWARNRIRTLSDYNKLSPGDERVQEVTNLGLTYRLLTAYTSVAQPLPLPEGVSEHAVSSPRRTFSRMNQYSAAPVMREEMVSKKIQQEPTHKMEIDSVTGSVSKEELLTLLQKDKSVIKDCLNIAPYRKYHIQLTLDLAGIVKKVLISGGTSMALREEKCLKGILKEWQLPKPEDIGSFNISFDLLLE